MKNWWMAVVGILALGAIMFLSDLRAETPSGLPFIRNQNQYVEVNNKAAMLAYEIFGRALNGETVSDQDKAKLREALPMFEAMSTFDPIRVRSFMGSGICYMILGEKEKAAERFEQAVLNKRVDTGADKEQIELSVLECAALLSEVTLDLAAEEIANYNSLSQANDKVGAEAAKKRSMIYYEKALKHATMAVEGKPDSPKYLVDRANVYLALKKEDLAKEDVAKAKVLSPDDPRVKMAAKMLGL